MMHVRHYKGGDYTVLCYAQNTEKVEMLVIYRSDETGIVWARSYDDFNAMVLCNDELVPRFRLID